MRRVIYSFYIEIPQNKLVSHHETNVKFIDHKHWLLERQREYAKSIGVDYIHYTDSKKFIHYEEWFKANYPKISYYNIVNFYKIHLMYELAKEYDEVLYMDMDVIPVTNLNFFEEFDLSKGIAIMSGTGETQTDLDRSDTLRWTHSVRSPMAKLWNSKCMLTELDVVVKEPEVFNTGIVGARKEHLKQLAYFSNFESDLNTMAEMIDDDFYPKTISYMFGYDNETLWGVKTYQNNVPFQALGEKWHWLMDKWSYIKEGTHFIHCISKDFDHVRKWCEKNNIHLISE